MTCASPQSDPRPRLPVWMRRPLGRGDAIHHLKGELRGRRLFTVCEEARCPNLGECWSRGTATLMLMGDVCTRACGFCAVKSGKPGALDLDEPEHVADQIHAMGLKHVVITSVNRDDLSDGGARHFAETIRATRRKNPGTTVEVLTPDFEDKREAIEDLCAYGAPDIFSHNIETVERLTAKVRSKARYRRSLHVLEVAKTFMGERFTKSGMMVGLGETFDEVVQAMKDLRGVGIECITIGQYLQPTSQHLRVAEYIHPDRFKEYEEIAQQLGYKHAFCGPFVRSSYMSEQVFSKEPLWNKNLSSTLSV